MKLIFETCEPRPEVLKGELKEDIFAARLMDVILGKAEVVYQEPDVFFDNTFPTQGLKELLREAFGRLTGKQPSNNSVIRLETAFGGGKTHNLIALYHIARGGADARLLKGLLDPDLIPVRPIPNIVGIVGSDLETSEGFQHPDTSLTTWTLQGEIAHQLGGKKAYEIVRKSDEERGAAGVPSFEKLIGDTPTLILLDEMGRYLRAAKAVPTANKRSDLAEQAVATLISLLDFASAKPHVMVVLTLADSSDAFGKETDDLRKELEESKKVSNRRERVIIPTGEIEISAIVTHRLFRKIDHKGAEATASAYSQYYARLRDQEANLPERAVRAEYAQEKIKGEEALPETCPVCGNLAQACTCARVCPKCGQDPCACAKPRRLHAEGAPAQVFQRIVDQCADHKVAVLSRLFIRVEGSGKTGAAEARSLGLAIPQLAHKASGFILAHNHPSGDPTPSAHDRELTQAVKAAAATVGVRFLDHLIIGDAALFSFKANGLL